jgi:small-conductance mechanosensitive channel
MGKSAAGHSACRQFSIPDMSAIIQDHFLFKPLYIVAIAIAGILLQMWIRTLIHRFSEKHRLPSNVTIGIRVSSRWVILTAFLLASLAVLGVEIGNIWTLVSTALAMVAIGFVAVWSLLSNVSAFFILLVWHHWELGDHICVMPDNIQGRVEDMNMMFTILRTNEGEAVAIPNSLLLQRVIRVAARA